MSKNRPLKFTITFKLLGKEVKPLDQQLTEALKIEDYVTCAKIQSKMQDQEIKKLLK
jgi:hypothetical protein